MTEKNIKSQDSSKSNDPVLKDLLYKIVRWLETSIFTKSDIEFKTFKFTGAVAPGSVRHGLLFKPRDLIVLSVSDGQTAVPNYSLFTDENVFFTTSGACTIRCILGEFKE